MPNVSGVQQNVSSKSGWLQNREKKKIIPEKFTLSPQNAKKKRVLSTGNLDFLHSDPLWRGDVAGKGISPVRLGVFSQVIRSGECLRAERAFERPLARVEAHVTSQFVRSLELLVARRPRARVGGLSRVSAHVSR